jgi:hypothetical protein
MTTNSSLPERITNRYVFRVMDCGLLVVWGLGFENTGHEEKNP